MGFPTGWRRPGPPGGGVLGPEARGGGKLPLGGPCPLPGAGGVGGPGAYRLPRPQPCPGLGLPPGAGPLGHASWELLRAPSRRRGAFSLGGLGPRALPPPRLPKLGRGRPFGPGGAPGRGGDHATRDGGKDGEPGLASALEVSRVKEFSPLLPSALDPLRPVRASFMGGGLAWPSRVTQKRIHPESRPKPGPSERSKVVKGWIALGCMGVPALAGCGRNLALDPSS